MRELLVIGAGGFLGAIGRYLISSWTYRWLGVGFPWGTLFVNVLGCFALGILMAFAETRVAVSDEVRMFVGIGLLGSLTTFSTFSLETFELLRRSAYTVALLNTIGSLLLCLGAVVAGWTLTRWFSG